MAAEHPSANWSAWQSNYPDFSIGIEEEVMLLDPEDMNLANKIQRVKRFLPDDMVSWVSTETHQSDVEIQTDPFNSIGESLAQLRERRAALQDYLGALSLKAASAGTHPTERWETVRVTESARAYEVLGTYRSLAQREPTYGLHVQVGINDAEAATRLLNKLRAYIPVFLAPSANSPYAGGRETGFAAFRPTIFRAFPRTGLPPVFKDYADYVHRVNVLRESHAIGSLSDIWWDLRLQPKYGTLEVRIMDSQLQAVNTEGIASLIHAVAKLESGNPNDDMQTPEVIVENRFMTEREGVHAELIGFEGETSRTPVSYIIHGIISRYAKAFPEDTDGLDCIVDLMDNNGADRQLEMQSRYRSLRKMIRWMSDIYTK